MLRVRARTEEAGMPAAEPPAYSLEPLVQSCDNSVVGDCMEESPGEAVIATDHYELRATRCRSRFCNDCSVVAGYSLRRRLTPVLETFKHVIMLTLTVDPTLFGSPEEAYTWIRERRALGNLMRDLRRAGVVESKRYVWFLEFQQGGWPHWHVLVESDYVPHELLERCWGKNRPAGIEQVEGRPLFGFVLFSAPKFASAAHAANYATKYVIKAPRDGWPEWVLDYTGRVQRYGVSRGFWPVEEGQKGRGKSVLASSRSGHSDSCFCEACRQGVNPETGKARRVVPTVRERLRQCCRSCAVVRVRRECDQDGRVVKQRREFVAFSWRRVEYWAEFFGSESVQGVVQLGRLQLRLILAELFGSPVPGSFNRLAADWVPW